MAQNKENTWSATEAKENQQEIDKMVGANFNYLFIFSQSIGCFISSIV